MNEDVRVKGSETGQLEPYTEVIGPHVLEYEPPDVIHVHYVGDVQIEHFKAINAAILRVPAPFRAYLLRDARQGGSYTPETRTYMTKHLDPTKVAASITYGSSLQTRTVLNMLNKAMVLLYNKYTHAFFFSTESEARAWIENHRASQPAR